MGAGGGEEGFEAEDAHARHAETYPALQAGECCFRLVPLSLRPLQFLPLVLQEEATEPAQALQDVGREASILDIVCDASLIALVSHTSSFLSSAWSALICGMQISIINGASRVNCLRLSHRFGILSNKRPGPADQAWVSRENRLQPLWHHDWINRYHGYVRLLTPHLRHRLFTRIDGLAFGLETLPIARTCRALIRTVTFPITGYGSLAEQFAYLRSRTKILRT